MKVLQVCSSNSWGGIELQSIKVTRGLKERGHDARLLCSSASFIRSEAVKHALPFYTSIFGELNLWQSIKHTRKVIKEFQPDIIHVQLSHDLSVVSFALRLNRMKTPLLFTRRMESRIRKTSIIHKLIYSRITYAYAISSFIRDNFLKTSPMKADKVGVMHNGVNLDRFKKEKFDVAEIKKRYDIPDDALIIGTSGRISKMKGYEEFIECAAALQKKRSEKLFFLMVGGISNNEEEYAEYIHQLAKDKLQVGTYLFTGHTTEVEVFLSTMDIFVFASHRESFGNVLLEAAAMGIPIAASNSGGATDIVECGKSAICFEARNAQAMEMGIQKLLNNSSLANQIANAAKIKIILQFSDEFFFDNLISRYEEVSKKAVM